MSNITSARKRLARDTLFRAFHYSHLLSRYSPVTLADFDDKPLDLQSSEAKLVTQGLTDTYDSGW